MAQLDLILGPCPCDACRFRHRCATELLACAAFSMFMHCARWEHAPRAPTRAIYRAVLDDGERKADRPRLASALRAAAPH